jgi:cell division protein FtsI/penicillin-binding protein 2
MRNRLPQVAGAFEMGKRLQYRRVLWLAALLALAFAGLGYRLVDLQVIRHDELSLLAEKNTRHEFILQPRRGDILDVKGNLLATSVAVKTVYADPSLIGNHQQEVARAVAPLLQLGENDLVRRLMPVLQHNPQGTLVTNQYVVLKHKVAVETWQKIQAAMTNLTFGVEEKKLPAAERSFYRNLRQKAIAVDPVDDQLRVYPNQTLAAHVLGYVGADQQEVNGRHFLQTAGKDGIELTFNSMLAGVWGWRLTETDRRERELVPWRDQDVEARDGLNVVLSVDSVIQSYLETALAEGMEQHAPLSISGIVMRPRTGEILAMATLPNFDPNNPGLASADARRNRVIADIAEPGSTFKIVVVSAALNEGAVNLSDVFDCEHGYFFYAGHPLRDHEPYGALSVEQIITKSSNIGAAKVGIKMGQERLYEYIQNFGFGAATGIPLPGEVSGHGFVHPLKDWSKLSIARIPMGQGISTTRLQMLLAMCAIANQGVLMRPMLVERIEDHDGKVWSRYAPQRVRQVITPATAKEMVTALKTVVSPEGTAPKAALEHYTVAGKTGTAQKVEAGKYVSKYFASFIGFFPADNPELCISVTMDEPKHGYYGGQVAAPVFKQIAERTAGYLSIPPDHSDPPAVAGSPLAPMDFSPVRNTGQRTQ